MDVTYRIMEDKNVGVDDSTLRRPVTVYDASRLEAERLKQAEIRGLLAQGIQN
jgi:hypothetical protein